MIIEHVAVYVNDLEGVRDFFLRYFGGSLNSGYYNERTGFRSYFISFDSGSRLELMTRPEIADMPRDTAQMGYAHIAFSLGSEERVDELTEKLRADGYEVISGPRITGDGYYESCISAFEGNIIELTV